MNASRKLRLGPLPQNDTVKINVSLTAELKSKLDRYATVHAELYGQPVDAIALIPHMLEAFIARDRAFNRTLR